MKIVWTPSILTSPRSDTGAVLQLPAALLNSLLAGEVPLGKELLRDYINATVGFPDLAKHTKLHVKTLHKMFGLKGNPTASNLFQIVAYLQRQEGFRLQVRTVPAVA